MNETYQVHIQITRNLDYVFHIRKMYGFFTEL